jgi:hypothetical protein
LLHLATHVVLAIVFDAIEGIETLACGFDGGWTIVPVGME